MLHMTRIVFSLIVLLSFFSPSIIAKTNDVKNLFNLSDYYKDNPALTQQTDAVFASLNDSDRVAQMIISVAGRLGRTDAEVAALINDKIIGGVLLLNGSVESFSSMATRFNALARTAGALPMLYSADAEPTLFNIKIKNTPPVPDTNKLDIPKTRTSAFVIAQELKKIGIHQNYAPVIDTSANLEIINNRSFGNDEKDIIAKGCVFTQTLQQQNIVATAKHFPGHGNVKGDSHKELVYIDGALKELRPYYAMIDAEVISIMVGHIAIRNNEQYDTHGIPATCSKLIVTDLLRNKMNFKGIIVTDAMWMKALKDVPNPDLEAAKAGCDMILMPIDERKCHADILAEMQKDIRFQSQVYDSVKRIIRLKICLGLL